MRKLPHDAGKRAVAVAGLSGTGKPGVARAVAGELGLRVVSADAVRKSLFADTAGAGYGEGPYRDCSPETHLVLNTGGPIRSAGKAATDWLRLYDTER